MKRRKHHTYQPGLAPGTIRERTPVDGGRLTITVYDYDEPTLKVRTGCGVEDVAPAHEGGYRWINVDGTPTSGLMRRIGREFGAHNLILEDITSPIQRIKVEDYDNLMFTVLRTIRIDSSGVEDESDLSIILTPTTLITLFEGSTAELFAPIVARLENSDSLLRHNGADFLYHALIDLMVDCLFPVIQGLEDKAEQVEEMLLDHPGDSHLAEIHGLRSNTQTARSILWSTRDVISRIERSTHRFIQPGTLFYFRDIHDHVVHLLDAISTLRDTASALMELYMSGVSNRMNEVMKVLTIISTIFIPGTFIAGVYGMNFTHMPELKVPWAYPVVLGIMAATAIGMLLFFRRRKWF